MRRAARRPLGTSVAVVAALWFGAWAAAPLDGGWRTAALDVLWSALAALAGAAALVERRRRRAELRRALFLLGAGSLAWAAGQAIWTYHEIVLGHEIPYPSLADACYLAALPLLGAGVLAWPRGTHGWTLGDAFHVALGLCVAALFSYEFVLQPILDRPVTGASAWLDVAYPVAELALAAVAAAGFLLHDWQERARLLVLVAGLLALAAADSAFILADDHAVGSLVEPGWTLPFLAVALAAFLPDGWRAGGERRVPEWVSGLVLSALLGAVLAHDIVEESRMHAASQLLGHVGVAALAVALTVHSLLVGRARHRQALELAGITRELESAYEYRNSALEASRTGICLFGADGVPRFCNSAFRLLLGFAGADRITWHSFVARLGGAVQPGDEIAFWGRDDLFLRVRLSPLASGGLLASVDDGTGEERERASRDRFMAEIVAAGEREARRISELVHDDAVQQLTALGLQLELAAATGDQEALAAAAANANRVTASLRRLVVELHPAVLESQGLSAAIEASAEPLREQGVEVDVAYFEDRLAPETEFIAYRLVQEALANALKHARASRVEVSLSLAEAILRGRVRDDGVGCDPERVEDAVARGHLGLHIVRERVEMTGGRFLLQSQPSGGTTFSFELPAAVAAASRAVEGVR